METLIDPRKKLQDIIDNQLNRLENKEVDSLNEAITLIAIEYSTWHTMIHDVRVRLSQLLPKDCIHGWGEVKFCSVRNGEGWECKQCAI